MHLLHNGLVHLLGHPWPSLAMAAAAPNHGQVALDAKPMALEPAPLEGPGLLGDHEGLGFASLVSRTPLGHGLAPTSPWPRHDKHAQEIERSN